MTRKELINELYNLKYADDVPVRHKPVITAMIDTILDAPAIEAQPIRRGRWLKDSASPSWVKCSECGTYLYIAQVSVSKYCYNCGSKMEGDE